MSLLCIVRWSHPSYAFADLSPPQFSPEGFLYGLLPPIVFGAGFAMKKKKFFQNFGAIMLFAVVGTVISTVVFSVCTLILASMGVISKHNIGERRTIKIFMYGKWRRLSTSVHILM